MGGAGRGGWVADERGAVGVDGQVFKLELERYDTQSAMEQLALRTGGADPLFWRAQLQGFVGCQAGFYEEASTLLRGSKYYGEGGRQLSEEIVAEGRTIEAKASCGPACATVSWC